MSQAFYIFSVLAVGSSITILFTRQLFHAALLLLVCLLSIAGIYVISFAELIAVTQILIYAGGILVIILFGIMLTTKIAGKPLVVTNNKWFAGFSLGIPLLVILLYGISEEDFNGMGTYPQAPDYTLINRIGIELMTDFLLPFEMAGILLLIALVGAAVTASQNEKGKRL
jgi:NADH:ubiquinone oxidoreductase subunit 6 (subunit J)